MKKVLPLLLAFALCSLVAPTPVARAQGTALTYQGRLDDAAGPANGTYDFQFTVRDALTGGSSVGVNPLAATLAVSNGLFTVTLDPGAGVFTGANRWLEIAVRTNGAGAFTILAPRQKITATPYSITAANVSWSGISGVPVNLTSNMISSLGTNALELKANGARALRLEPNTNGAPNLIAGSSANYISAGTVGAVIAGGGATNYSGSAFTPSNSVTGDFGVVGGGQNNNVNAIYGNIGGGVNNTVSQDTSVIGGGGANQVQASKAVIAGGFGNNIGPGAAYGAIGGGQGNYVSGQGATIPGGENNHATGVRSLAAGYRAKATNQGAFVWADATGADFASTSNNQFLIRAAGGVGIGTNNPQSELHVVGNIIASNFTGSGAGLTNIGDAALSSNVVRAANGIVTNTLAFSGASNMFTGKFTGDGSMLTNVDVATLGGVAGTNFWQLGGNNVAAGQFLGSTNNQPLELQVNGVRTMRLEPNANVIGGSHVNFVAPGTGSATIAGGGTVGYTNSTAGHYSFIGGGAANNIESASTAAIGGGYQNTIRSGADGSLVGGGAANTIQSNATYSAIGGGLGSIIFSNADFAVIGGGWANYVLNDASYSTIGGGLNHFNRAPYSTIAGGQGNAISVGATNATVGGGLGNGAAGAYSTIAGGSLNLALGKGAFIGGGGTDGTTTQGNVANGNASTIGGGLGNLAGGIGAFIGGGGIVGTTLRANVASGNASVIAGGFGNTNNARCSTIGGGERNTIQLDAQLAAIGGGFRNTIQAGSFETTIGGGVDNTIGNIGWWSTIGGGINNVISEKEATIAGGANNSISSLGAVGAIGGGANNSVTGSFGTVPGGSANSATSYAFAAGRRAKAINTGSFVWADSTDADFATTASNQFLIRASGGVGIGTTSPNNALDVNGQLGLFGAGLDGSSVQRFVLYADTPNGMLFEAPKDSGGNKLTYHFNWRGGGTDGMTLTPSGLTVNGVFVSSSDRNLKENFTPVNARSVLDKVLSLPISGWNFKADDSTHHIGPMAQDFRAAFGLGTDDKHIATVDADGVALAAIQGLNQKLEETRAENAELKQRLESVEKLLNRLTVAKEGGGR